MLLWRARIVINVQGDERYPLSRSVPAAGLERDAAIATLAAPFVQPQDSANVNQVKVARDREPCSIFSLSYPLCCDTAGQSMPHGWRRIKLLPPSGLCIQG